MDLNFQELATDCAPDVAFETIAALVKTESDFDPIALNVNGAQSERSPRNTQEAINWANALIAEGRSVDLGLAQINSANLSQLGITVEQVFDPCTNLKAAQTLLLQNYMSAAQDSSHEQQALQKALSAYNTGSETRGFTNGYVQRVVDNAAPPTPMASKVPVISGAAAVAPSMQEFAAFPGAALPPRSNPLIVFLREATAVPSPSLAAQDVAAPIVSTSNLTDTPSP